MALNHNFGHIIIKHTMVASQYKQLVTWTPEMCIILFVNAK